MQSVRLIDLVFPGDTNHHGTLFGGLGLAFMDKIAFIVASQHGRVDFVTASAERIDFTAPANVGEIIEFTGQLVRVGKKSLTVEVMMVAEVLVSGERRLCSKGKFNMVAVGVKPDYQLPPLQAVSSEQQEEGERMVEMVFPNRTSHYGSLFGGHGLAAMAKGAFIAATRRQRKKFVLASTEQVNFERQIPSGAIMEVYAQVMDIGRRATKVKVELMAEHLLTGERYPAANGYFIMVQTPADHLRDG